MILRSRVVKATLLGIAMTLSLVFQADAQDAEKQAIIQELLEITGVEQLSLQVVDAMTPGIIKMISSAYPDIPDEIMKILREEMLNTFESRIPEYIALSIPLYDESFTTDEIKAAVSFYKSEAGQKFVQLQPALMQKMILLGQRWGQSTGQIAIQNVIKRLEEEGYAIE